jgi:hypothetical protein
MNGIARDQTRNDVKSLFPGGENEFDAALGTGIFVVPAPDLGTSKYKKIVVFSITHKEFVSRGRDCHVVKWVPEISLNREMAEDLALRTCDPNPCSVESQDCYGICVCLPEYKPGDQFGWCF